MQKIGTILKNAREEKKLTIENVYKATRIQESYIAGLENSDLSAFPAELYYRGFLKSYAKYLGLNSDELLSIYDEFKKEKQKEQKIIIEKVVVQAKYKKVKLFITIFVAILILGSLICAQINLKNNKSVAEQAASAVPVEEVQETEIAEEQPVAAEPEIEKPKEPVKQKLFVQAISETWIRVTSNKQYIYEGTLRTAEKYTWYSQYGFTVKTGYAPGVTVYFNGKKVDMLKGARRGVNTIILQKDENIEK